MLHLISQVFKQGKKDKSGLGLFSIPWFTYIYVHPDLGKKARKSLMVTLKLWAWGVVELSVVIKAGKEECVLEERWSRSSPRVNCCNSSDTGGALTIYTSRGSAARSSDAITA